MTELRVDSAIDDLKIPATAFVVDRVHEMKGVEKVLAAAEAEVTSGLDEKAIEADAHLAAYRELHQRVGARARDVAAPEALRRMLLKSGSLPRIGPVVNLYNAISLRTRLALGAHDLDQIDGAVDLRLTTGEERFVPLGRQDPKPVRAGEYAYVDEAGDVLCRLEVRQGDKTKMRPETERCLIVVQGNASLGEDAVGRGVDELMRLFTAAGADSGVSA
jgi:DNA/RNA-binding domain of Phe-tRNA-synthetase-like protein